MSGLLKNRRVLAGLVLVLALIAVALWPKSVPVELEPVARGAMQVTLDDEGKTRVRQRFTVTAPVAGRVERIGLEPGDPVDRDTTVLAVFRPESPALLDARSRAEAEATAAAARAALGRTEAERDRAVAAAALASAEAERHRLLAATGIVSQETLEARETEALTASEALRAAEFATDQARHELARARARLASSTPENRGRGVELRSPIDGVVLQRFRESEGVVGPGEPLVEVADPSALEIVADLLSSDAVRVRPGQPVEVDGWGGDGPLAGRVRRVEPFGFTKISALGVEEQRVNVLIDFIDPAEAWAALGDGYRVEVRIVVWAAEDVLTAPTSALFRRGEVWAAFVATDGRARLASVEIGERNASVVEVRSGLTEGQSVIVHPGDRVIDGARVVPRE